MLKLRFDGGTNSLVPHERSWESGGSMKSFVLFCYDLSWHLWNLYIDSWHFVSFTPTFEWKVRIWGPDGVGKPWLSPVFVNKMYWNTVPAVRLHIMCGCFHPAMAQLNSCDRDHIPTSLQYLLSGPHRKILQTHALEESCQLWKWPSSLEFSSKAHFNIHWIILCWRCPSWKQKRYLYGFLPAMIPTYMQIAFSQKFVKNFKIQKNFKENVWWAPIYHHLDSTITLYTSFVI